MSDKYRFKVHYAKIYFSNAHKKLDIYTHLNKSTENDSTSGCFFLATALAFV
jgi:hypothetical protein